MHPSFEIKPFVGAGDLTFGMTPDDVRSIVGSPERSIRNRKGGVDEYRKGFKVCYDQASQIATDFVLFPPAKALYRGIDLLGCDDPVNLLVSDDPAPLEGMGIVVFFGLGITITGFTDTDRSDDSITVFAKGRWDSLGDQLRPLRGR